MIPVLCFLHFLLDVFKPDNPLCEREAVDELKKVYIVIGKKLTKIRK